MKKTVAFAAVLFAVAAQAQTAVPEKIGYQGRLLKADGTPESASVTLKFQLFDAATSGTSLWTESQSVQPVDGFYSLVLGKTTAFPATAFDGSDRWLEISVNGTPLSPRQSVSSVPYAIRATNLAGGTVDATSIKVGGTTVIDSSGKLAGTAVKLGAGSGLAFDTSSNLSLLKTCTDGQVLKYLSGAWTCATDNSGSGGSTYTAGAGVAISGTNAISVMACNANGQVLTWNGSTWTCALPPSGSAGITAVNGTAPVTATTSGSTVTLSMAKASATVNGYLDKADFARFDAKPDTKGANLVDWFDDATRWTPTATTTATVAVTTTDAKEGSGSFDFTIPSGQPSTFAYGDMIPVDPTAAYELRLWAKMTVGAGPFSAGLMFYNAAGAANGTTSCAATTVTLTQGVWTEFHCRIAGEISGSSYSFNNGTRFVRPFITANAGNVGTTRVDGLQFFESHDAWRGQSIPTPSTAAVTFGGLTDSDGGYEIIIVGQLTNTFAGNRNVRLFPNSTAATGNFRNLSKRVFFNGATQSEDLDTGRNHGGFTLGFTDWATSGAINIRAVLHSVGPYEKVLQSVHVFSTSGGANTLRGENLGSWDNNAAKITSLIVDFEGMSFQGNFLLRPLNP